MEIFTCEDLKKPIDENDWGELVDMMEDVFSSEYKYEPELQNELANCIYSHLEHTGKLEDFVAGSKGKIPLTYIVRAGDLHSFKKKYKESNYFYKFQDIKSITKNSNNTIILDHVKLESSFLSSEQKKACIEDKIVFLIETRQKISVPIHYLIDIVSPSKIISEKKIDGTKAVVQTFELDIDNFGRGIINFLDRYDIKNIDMNFFQLNREFLHSLTIRELVMLSGYTHTGDKLVNIVLRNTGELDSYVDSIWKHNTMPYIGSIIPIYYQLLDLLKIGSGDPYVDNRLILAKWIKDHPRNEDFYKIMYDCVKMYILELKDIFKKAKSLEKEINVFRGTKTFYYGTSSSDVFITGDFTSASISPQIAIDFTEKDCCFTQMKLNRGLKVIFIEPVTQHRGELEILIPPGTKFKMIKNKIKKFSPLSGPVSLSDYKYAACNEETKNIRFTLMESL